MSRRFARVVPAFLLLGSVAGCEENHWGAMCTSDGDCGGDLVCAKTGTEENPATSGLCRYPDGKRGGPGTVLRGAECVPNPEIEEVTCGDGTVEQNGRCVAATDAGPGDEDAGPIETCPTPAEACGASTRCVAGQVLDFRTGQPVSAADDLRAIVNDPLAKPPAVLLEVPVGDNGCFVAADLPASSPVRLVDVIETEAAPDPDRVAYSVNFGGDGTVEGTCCDYPMYVVRTADEQAWSTALGLAVGSGVEATGGWAGFIVDGGAPVQGATLTNGGTDELRAHYFDADLGDFVDGATETGSSGGWLVLMTAPPFELATFSAQDAAATTYGEGGGGTVPGQITIAVIAAQ